MVAPPAPIPQLAAPPIALDDRLVDFLEQLLPSGRPRRVSQMLARGPDKYRDIPKAEPLTRNMLLDHAAGAATWAATLDIADRARAGVMDIDCGGRAAVLATLAAAATLGIHAWAIAVDNLESDHSGGHVWALYHTSATVADIVAQLRQLVVTAGLADVEIWPSAQVIRLPFGLHQRAQTRGQLVLQSGEVIDLDRDLAAALAAVQALPLNAAPPSAEAPAHMFCTPASAHIPHRRGISSRILSPGEQAAEQLSAADAIAQFNRTHPLSTTLERGAGGLYFCPCGGHDSGKPKIAIWTGRDRIERAQSYSPDCRWFPLHRSGKVLDPFEYFVLAEHGGDRIAALKAINPIAPYHAKSSPQPPHPAEAAEYLTHDAARKRTARAAARDERQARIVPLLDQLDGDGHIYPFARSVFTFHLSCWSEGPEHYASLERIARAVLTLDRPPTRNEIRRVQLAHARLIACGYLTRTVRYRPDERKTNCWQPGAGGMVIRAGLAHQEAVGDARITMHDLESDTESDSACERGGIPPLDAASSDELDPALLSYVRGLAREVAEPRWYLHDYASWSGADLEAEAARLEGLLRVTNDSAPPAPSGELPQIDQIADGASYDPAADWTTGGQLDPRLTDPFYNPLAEYHPRAPAPAELEPLALCPPPEDSPEYREFAWRWFAARQKHRSDGQRTMFRREADRRLVEAPATEAARRWAAFYGRSPAGSGIPRPPRSSRGAGVAPPLTSSRPVEHQTLDMFAGLPLLDLVEVASGGP